MVFAKRETSFRANFFQITTVYGKSSVVAACDQNLRFLVELGKIS